MQNEKANFGSQNPDLYVFQSSSPVHKKQTKEKSLKGPKCFFNFTNNRQKHGSYDFHNVEEEEPH